MSMIELMQEELLLVSGGRNQANGQNSHDDGPVDHGDAQSAQEQGDSDN